MKAPRFAATVFAATGVCLLVWFRSHSLDFSGLSSWYACAMHDDCPLERADRDARLERMFRQHAETEERLRHLAAPLPDR